MGSLRGSELKEGLEWWVGVYCRPLMYKPPPLNGDYKNESDIKALKGRGFIDQGSTSGLPWFAG